jgi:hypothetical protein
MKRRHLIQLGMALSALAAAGCGSSSPTKTSLAWV